MNAAERPRQRKASKMRTDLARWQFIGFPRMNRGDSKVKEAGVIDQCMAGEEVKTRRGHF